MDSVSSSGVENGCLVLGGISLILLICNAKVFHRDDEEYYNMYVNRLVGETIKFYQEDSRKEKIRKILHITKYSALVVFVVLLSHELLLLLLGDHKKEFLSSIGTAIGVSAIGGVSALILDSVVIWREKNN